MSRPPAQPSPPADRRPLRVVLVAVGLLVVTPVAVAGLALLGHWSSERPLVAGINRSLEAAARDLEGVATVVRSRPAEARAFVCCGDSGPSGDLVLLGRGDLASTVRGVREALLQAGWTLVDRAGDGTWLSATRDDLRLGLTIRTVEESAARHDRTMTAGQTRVWVTSR